MFKDTYHPKAFLLHKRNVRRGLATRSKIVSLLDQDSFKAKNISEKVGVGYSSVLYHLHLMEDEHIVARESGRPYIWKLTGVGQKSLM